VSGALLRRFPLAKKQQRRVNRKLATDYQPTATLIDLDNYRPHQRKKRIEIVPRSINQEEYVLALDDDEMYIVAAVGPAGCGKTLLATMKAIQDLQEGKIERIVITRPAVSTDEQHGFLPGDINQKMEPWVLPILDVFKEHYSVKEIANMLQEGILEIAPLAYMRGRTFKNAYVIADEMQNSTPSQTKMILTRIGDGSRIFITGDLQQHDRGYEANGLKDFLGRIKKSSHITVVEFSREDVKRHPVVKEVLELYGEE